MKYWTWTRLVLALAVGMSTFTWIEHSSARMPFMVTSTLDAPDAVPGDGTCETVLSNAVCTLRAAVQEANAFPGTDMISIPAGSYGLTRTGTDDNAVLGDLDVTSDMTLVGENRDTTIIDGGNLFGLFEAQEGATLSVSHMTLQHGRAIERGYGGAIGFSNAIVLVNDVIATDNIALIGGGAFGGNASLTGGVFGLTIDGSVIRNNQTPNGDGGGIYVDIPDVLGDIGQLTIRNTTITGNQAFSFAGGIRAFMPTQISGTSIVDNQASFAGGALFGRATSITNTTIEGNRALNASGLFNEAGGAVTLSDSMVRDNVATQSSGGIFNKGTMELNRVTISGNRSPNDGGGGISNAGPLRIENSTINGNSAMIAGGINNATEGRLTIVNSTISGNQASGIAGGISNVGQLKLYNVTITANQASSGAGIYYQSMGNFGDFLEARNTIIADNIGTVTDPDCHGTLTSFGHNLIESVQGCTIVGDITGNILGQSATLGSLQDNGGATFTHALLAGSSALDGGNPTGCISQSGAALNTDQRDQPRPIDSNGDGISVCDIGSYESVLIVAPSATTTATSSPTVIPTTTVPATVTRTATVTNVPSATISPSPTTTPNPYPTSNPYPTAPMPTLTGVLPLPTPNTTQTPIARQQPARVTVVLRVNPNHRVAGPSDILLTIEIVNRGFGAASNTTVKVPFDPAFVTVMDAQFSDPTAWVSELDTDALTIESGTLTPLGGVVTATIRLHTHANLPATLLLQRATYHWEDATQVSTGHSNQPILVGGSTSDHRPLYELERGISPDGQDMAIFRSPVFAPNEPVSAWITTSDQQTFAIGEFEADNEGIIELKLQDADLLTSGTMIVMYGHWTKFTVRSSIELTP